MESTRASAMIHLINHLVATVNTKRMNCNFDHHMLFHIQVVRLSSTNHTECDRDL